MYTYKIHFRKRKEIPFLISQNKEMSTTLLANTKISLLNATLSHIVFPLLISDYRKYRSWLTSIFIFFKDQIYNYLFTESMLDLGSLQIVFYRNASMDFSAK